MEIKREDWNNLRKQIENTVKNDTMTGKINKHVLAFVTAEMLKCPKPSPTKTKEHHQSG